MTPDKTKDQDQQITLIELMTRAEWNLDHAMSAIAVLRVMAQAIAAAPNVEEAVNLLIGTANQIDRIADIDGTWRQIRLDYPYASPERQYHLCLTKKLTAADTQRLTDEFRAKFPWIANISDEPGQDQ